MKKTYDDVRAAFDNRAVISASKSELEELLMALGESRILSAENQARASEMGETMRLLLAARQSQEMHSSAMATAKVALIVAAVALLTSLLQLFVSLNLVSPLRTPIWKTERVINSAEASSR